jgi:hypothetical protein
MTAPTVTPTRPAVLRRPGTPGTGRSRRRVPVTFAVLSAFPLVAGPRRRRPAAVGGSR